MHQIVILVLYGHVFVRYESIYEYSARIIPDFNHPLRVEQALKDKFTHAFSRFAQHIGSEMRYIYVTSLLI